MKTTFCTVADDNFNEGLKILIFSLYKNIPNFLEYDFVIFNSKRLNVILSNNYSFRRYSDTCEPINPAQPVTIIFIIIVCLYLFIIFYLLN